MRAPRDADYLHPFAHLFFCLQMEIRQLRDEAVALEAQIRKLKLAQSRLRRQQDTASATIGAGTTATISTETGGKSSLLQSDHPSMSAIEVENSELKAAVLAQKAQLSSLIDRMRAHKLLEASQEATAEAAEDAHAHPHPSLSFEAGVIGEDVPYGSSSTEHLPSQYQ